MSGLQDSRLPWLLVVVRERTGHGAEERSGQQDRSWWPWTKIQLARPENQAASLQNSWYLTMRRWTISQHLWVLQNEGLQRLHGPPLSCSLTLSPPFSSSETLTPGSLLPLFSILPLALAAVTALFHLGTNTMFSGNICCLTLWDKSPWIVG